MTDACREQRRVLRVAVAITYGEGYLLILLEHRQDVVNDRAEMSCESQVAGGGLVMSAI